MVYTSKNYITFHASSSGKKIMNLPNTCDVFEVYEEKYYGKSTKSFEFYADFGETKMFRLVPKSST